MSQLTFALSVQRPSTETAKTVEERLVQHLKLLPRYHCQLQLETLGTSSTAVELETYADKISRLTDTVQLMARDFDTSGYSATLSRVQQHTLPTEHDEATLSTLTRLSQHLPQLARIRRFLIPLPATPAYTQLSLEQDLLQIRLQDALRDPTRFDGALLQEFENYHAAYAKAYREYLTLREEQLQAWQDMRQDTMQQLFVLQQLDALPLLGAPEAPALRADLEQLERQYQPTALSPDDMRKILELEPMIAGVSLHAALPQTVFGHVADRVTAALQGKIARISEASVLQLLATSKEIHVQKLTRLLSLTQLPQITKLFTPKTAPALMRELTKLLGPKGVQALSFGDFHPSLTTLKTAQDAAAVSAEFSAYLTTRLTGTPYLIR